MIKNCRPRLTRKGTSLVEFSLIFVVFLMFMFGVFEYARYLFALNLLSNAAREGARFAVVHTTTATTSQVQDYVDGYLGDHGFTAINGYSKSSNISVYQADTTTGQDNGKGWQNAGAGQAIGVKVSGTYYFIGPSFLYLGASVQIQGTAVMYSETN